MPELDDNKKKMKPQEESNPSPEDPKAPPPYLLFQQSASERKKIILLVAGIQPQILIFRKQKNGFLAVPEFMALQTEIKKAKAEGRWFKDVIDDINEAWEKLTVTYSSPPFKNSGWELWRLWATKPGEIIRTLVKIYLENPDGVALHYIGHGTCEDPGAIPSLELVPLKKMEITGNLKKPIKLEYPAVESRYTNLEKTIAVAGLMKILFPPEIPKTLIVDGCCQANALKYEDSSVNFRVVTAVHVPTQACILGAFSKYFDISVAPACFEHTSDALDYAVENTRRIMKDVPVTSPFFECCAQDAGIGKEAYQCPACRRSSISQEPCYV